MVVRLFISKYWKWLLPILVLAAVIAWTRHHINDLQKEAYAQGEVAERSVWEQRIADENRRNREREHQLADVIADLTTRYNDQNSRRDVYEQGRVDRIETIIRGDPSYENCRVDEDLLRLRNEILSQGPNNE